MASSIAAGADTRCACSSKGGKQYLCNHLRQQTGAPVCQRIGGAAIDDAVVASFFETLSVAEIDAAAAALQTADAEHDQVIAAHQQQVQRLRYEAQLAERQFMKSDPDNRLVTGEQVRSVCGGFTSVCCEPFTNRTRVACKAFSRFRS